MAKDINVDIISDNARTPGGEIDDRALEQEYLEAEKGKMNTIQFCVNLMKGIAGTGSLAIPSAFSYVGIIPGICLFVLVCGMMILATYQLLEIHNNMGNRRILGLKSIQTNNVYAEMVFNVLGTAGYYMYVIFSLVTLYGSNIGTLIVMTDFFSAIPFTSGDAASRRPIAQILLTIVSIILCLLKDPSLLVPISSFGLVAIIVGYIILIFYGFATYKPAFEAADLWPRSIPALLENIGIFVYCMGFILFLLTQYGVVKSTAISIAIMAVIYSFMGIVLSQYYKTSPKGIQENIIQSLPDDFSLGTVLNILMCITVVGGFPLWMEPVNETIEGDDKEYGKVFITSKKYIIIRSVEIILMSLIAYVVPSFQALLGLIGNFTDVLTTFIFPAVMHIVFFRNRVSSTIMGLDFATLFISVMIMVICTAYSLKNFTKKEADA